MSGPIKLRILAALAGRSHIPANVDDGEFQ